MANITLSETPDTAASGYDQIRFLANTATAVITPEYSGVDRIASSVSTPYNYNIDDFESASSDVSARRGFLTGRRPSFGLLFPRGYYNR
jgi:hypothetical protein